jgi:RNA polymerase-binding transcription factor DksA
MRVSTSMRPTLAPEELAELHAQLVQQKSFREQQLRSLAAVGTADRLQREIADKLRAAARTALRDVEDALARMRSGSYGRCVGCGMPVPAGRLEVLPQAARCMPCQREADAR